MSRRSKIRLGKDETIENTVLLGTSQNWYDHIIRVTCSKYKVDPTEIKSLYLATKFTDHSKEQPGTTAHRVQQFFDAEATKKCGESSNRARKSEIIVNQIVKKYEGIEQKPVGAPQQSKLPKSKPIAKGVYDPLTFDRYIALGDRQGAEGRIGSLERPHLIAVFTNKAREKNDKQAYVIVSQAEGRFEVYNDLQAVKERLYGRSNMVARLTLDRYVVLGDESRAKGELGSLDLPHQVAVFKDKRHTGKEAFVIISKVKSQNGTSEEHSNFGKGYGGLDIVKKKLYGAGAASKDVKWGEGKSVEKAIKNLRN